MTVCLLDLTHHVWYRADLVNRQYSNIEGKLGAQPGLVLVAFVELRPMATWGGQ
jgi:hypothetical protein